MIETAEKAGPSCARPLYEPDLGLKDKVERIAREIYGADGVYFESAARKKLKKFGELGFGSLPVCIAKTQSSLSDNPKLHGAPRSWTLTVTDPYLAAGAGFVIVLAGNMTLMPGLSKNPQAMRMDVDDAGNIIGLT